MKKCGIYIITNLQNGKRYIGSSKNLYERLYKHFYDLENNKHSNTYLQNSWDKYGGESFIYGILEKPFRNLYASASKMKGLTGPNLMILLELRLDNIIYRLGFARTRKEARQIVGHKHVLVNGKQVNIPSYRVKQGDKIEIREKSKSSQRYKDVLDVTSGRIVPSWLESNQETLAGTVLELPLREQIDVPVNETLIVELYSK